MKECCTPEEYLRAEKAAVEKHQYFRGEIFVMTGGSPAHSLISANLIRELGNALKGGPCRVYDSNLRIRVPRTTLYTYPDVSVICGTSEYDPLDIDRQTVLNPKVLVEVLSPSTEAYDRGAKFVSYRQIESFQEYLLLSQDEHRAETFLRQPDGAWRYLAFAGLDATVRLASLAADLRLADLYAGVEFPKQPEQPAEGAQPIT